MPSSLIGALRVTLGLDSAAFEKGAANATKSLKKTERSFETMGRRIAGVGVGMTAAITAPFIALVSKAVPAAIESQKAIAQVNAALASMGPVAGRTSKQLEQAAKSLQHISTFDDDEILRSVTANLLTFGNVSTDVFDKAQVSIVDMATRLKIDLQSATIQVGKALNDPVHGLAALGRSGAVSKEWIIANKGVIEGLVETGQRAKAQGIILAELNRQFAGSAKAQRDATPGADAIDAWRDFEETLGAIALRVLPPLTKLLTGLLNTFNTLSPGMQTFAVGAAAAAAALGPLLIGVGALVGGFGRLLPLLIPAAGNAEALAAAFVVLRGVLGPLAIAATAAYIAFKKLSEVDPTTHKSGWDSLNESFKEGDKTLSSFNKAVNDFEKSLGVPPPKVLDDWLNNQLAEGLKHAQANLLAFNNAVNATEAAIIKFATSAAQAFDQLWQRAVKAFDNMVKGIQNAIGSRLKTIFDGVKAQVKAVGDAFANLYNRVIGRSYVPDMVDGIAVQMARLDAVMVQPANKATSATAQAFADLAGRVNSILDRLFPESAALKEWRQDVSDLQKGMEAGMVTADLYNEALMRLNGGAGLDEVLTLTTGQPATVDNWANSLNEVGDALEEIPSLTDPAIEAADKMGDAFIAAGRSIGNSLRNALEDGKISLNEMIDLAIDAIGAIISVINRGSAGGGFFQALFSGFAGGFASGGIIPRGQWGIVGEKGPELAFAGNSPMTVLPSNDNNSVFNINVTAPNSGDQRRDRQAAMQQAALIRNEVAKASRQGF